MSSFDKETKQKDDKNMSVKQTTEQKNQHSSDGKLFFHNEQHKSSVDTPARIRRPVKDKLTVDKKQKTEICVYGKKCKFYPNCRFEHPPGMIPELKKLEKPKEPEKKPELLKEMQEMPESSKKSNICINGKNCKFYPNCRFKHPPDMIPDCRYGKHCSRYGCLFSHPEGYIPGISPIEETNETNNPVIQTKSIFVPIYNSIVSKVQPPVEDTCKLIEPELEPEIDKDSYIKPLSFPFESTHIESNTEEAASSSFSEDLYIIKRIIQKTKFKNFLEFYYEKVNNSFDFNEIINFLISNLKYFTQKMYNQLCIINEFLILRNEEHSNDIYVSFMDKINNVFKPLYNEIIFNTISDDAVLTFDLLIRKISNFVDTYDNIIIEYNDTFIDGVKLDETNQPTSNDIINNIIYG